MTDAWRNPSFDQLCDAFLELRTREDQGTPYARIATELQASTATVTRVAHWLNHGEGGYRLVLDRTEPQP